MSGTRDYRSWTKEGLIKKIKLLESQLASQQRQQGQNIQQPRPNTPPHPKKASPSPSSPPPPPVGSSSSKPSGVAAATPPPKKKKQKGVPRNASEFSTRYIALKLAYLGKNYNGLEYQPSGALPAIEEELWKALVKTCLIFPDPERDPSEVDFKVCDYSKCGRTDRGVSAFGQVVALRVKSNKPLRKKKQSAVQLDQDGSGEAASASTGAVDAAGAQVVPEDSQPGQEDEQEGEEDDAPYPADKEIKYCKMLNAVLPVDIRVLAWCPNPPPGFSARHSCHERQYRYFFTQPIFSPVPARLDGVMGYKEPGSTHKDGYLDLDAMREAARLFEGEHDFRNFCKIDASKQISNFKRLIREASIVEVPEAASSLPYLDTPDFRPSGEDSQARPKVYYFHVRGSAFLWHQIRHMIAVLFLVGQRLEKPSIVSELLDIEKYPGKPNYPMASDAPLVLWDCLYGGRTLPDGSTHGELEWIYAGADGDSPDELYNRKGLLDELWAHWRGKKMDELLTNQLLQRAATMVEDPERQAAKASTKPVESGPQPKKSNKAPSRKTFEGDDWYRQVGMYEPLAQRYMLETPDEVNDKWARSKGFESAVELSENPEWRSVIKARKAAAAAALASEAAKCSGA